MTDVPLPGHPFSRRPPIAPVLIGGVVAVVLFTLRSPVAAWIKGFLSHPAEPTNLTGTSLLNRNVSPCVVRNSILGRGKSAVAACCGAPRTAAGAAGKVVIGSRRPNYWNADTWYYPINARTQTAIAVKFENGIAREVEFFGVPQSR